MCLFIEYKSIQNHRAYWFYRGTNVNMGVGILNKKFSSRVDINHVTFDKTYLSDTHYLNYFVGIL
jgi:hypothetical protein